MVEKELDLDFTQRTPRSTRTKRRVSFGASMVGIEGARHFTRPVEIAVPEPFEWVAAADTFPAFITELIQEWKLDEREVLLHQGIAGVIVWDKYFYQYKMRLGSAQRLPQYFMARIVPDLSTLIDDFGDELRPQSYYDRSVKSAFSTVVLSIQESYDAGTYAVDTAEFLKKSPFTLLYRGKDAPFKLLYERAILKNHRFNPYRHDFFPNKDHSFFGWMLSQLHQHYAIVQ